MNKNRVTLLLATLAFSAPLFAQTPPSNDPTVPSPVYEASLDLSSAPERINQSLPLSDQENRDGWVLLTDYSDEFESKSLNEDKWYPNNPGWKGRQPTYFHESNVEIKDGYAVFSINQHGDEELPEGFTHTSGFLVSKEKHLYGYFEARLKANDSPWVFGFWMTNGTPEWWTEIDICENCSYPEGSERNLNSNVHVFRSPADQGDVKEHFALPKKYYLPFDLGEGFHTWGMDWTEDYIRLYFDGVLFREIENTHWHQELKINLNNESNKWLGALPEGDHRIDEKYLVDYVRVWKRK